MVGINLTAVSLDCNFTLASATITAGADIKFALAKVEDESSGPLTVKAHLFFIELAIKWTEMLAIKKSDKITQITTQAQLREA